MLIIEFVVIIESLTPAEAAVQEDMNVDERIVDVISDSCHLPIESVIMINNLEREIFEKLADHERRVWGELEPQALSKYKLQQDELTKLYGSLQSLKTKIEEERNTQERILRDMREALLGPNGSKLY
jgi:ABC-type phosphate transport system auxiliary subunit